MPGSWACNTSARVYRVTCGSGYSSPCWALAELCRRCPQTVQLLLLNCQLLCLKLCLPPAGVSEEIHLCLLMACPKINSSPYPFPLLSLPWPQGCKPAGLSSQPLVLTRGGSVLSPGQGGPSPSFMGLMRLRHVTVLAGGPKASGLVKASTATVQGDREPLAGRPLGWCRSCRSPGARR